MKKLTALVALLSILNVMYTPDVWPDSPPTNIEASYSFVNNKLKNPGFEQGLYGWTASVPSTMTLEKTASLVDDGSASLKFVSTATGQTITGTAIPLLNTSGIASTTTLWTTSCRFQTSNTDYLMQAVDQSGNVISSQISTDTIPSSTNYTRYTLSYYLPSGVTSVSPRFKAQSAGTLHADKCYTGPAEGFNAAANVSGGQWVGSINWSCTGVSWWQVGPSVTSWTDMGNNSSCTPTPSGNLSVSGTTTDAILSGAQPGTYRVVYTSDFRKSTGNVGFVGFRVSDGTNAGASTGVGNTGTIENNGPATLEAAFTYNQSQLTTMGGTVTWRVQGITDNNGNTARIGQTNTEPTSGTGATAGINNLSSVLRADVYYFGPGAGGTQATFSNTPAYVRVNQSFTSGQWSFNSTTGYADPAAATGVSVSVPVSRNFGVITSSTTLPQITLNFPKAGGTCYDIDANMWGQVSGTSNYCRLDITDGTTIIGEDGLRVGTSGGSNEKGVDPHGPYCPTSTGAVTLKVQGTSTTTATCDVPQIFSSGAIQWTISQKDAPSGTVSFNNQIPGEIFPFAGSACPSGSVTADGSSLARSGQYANLFAAIGTAWGTADGTHFNAPDLRGIFPRGADNMGTSAGAASKDPDAASRLALHTGGATTGVGSYQADQFASHTHDATIGNSTGTNVFSASNPFAMGDNGGGGASTRSNVVQARGGNETRGKNAYVLYCVRY